MKLWSRQVALFVCTAGAITAASASELTVPNTFSSGTPAVAAQVNANFDATEAAVNDNNTRINLLLTQVQSLTTQVQSLTTQLQSATTGIGTLSARMTAVEDPDYSVPSGVTVTGTFRVEVNRPGTAAFTTSHQVSFPFRMPAQPSQVNFSNSNFGDADASCSGDQLVPTAPPGKVCLYATAFSGVNPAGTEGLDLGGGRDGVHIFIAGAAGTEGARVYVTGAWAYTAP